MQGGLEQGKPAPTRWPFALHALTLTVWAGALWTVGYVVAPVLFATLDKISAGNLAARLFSLVTWIGVACALILIVLRAWVLPAARNPRAAAKAPARTPPRRTGKTPFRAPGKAVARAPRGGTRRDD